MTINYTLLASCIAATASITAALIAFFSKNKDFKNDYYKRIIDKRLKAYEEVELIIFSLRRTAIVRRSPGSPNEEVGSVFLNEKAFDAFVDSLHEVIKKGLWLSTQSRIELIELNNKLLTIKIAIKPDYEDKVFDKDKLIEEGIRNFSDIEVIRKNLNAIFVREVIDMQNVKSFFAQLSDKG
ncbi:MAG: hypothetical protein EOO61_16055 [Hymenobacter sp.]|nr:MAG: hypothetical protein EOO61_16055 [Hymenobacter sp.]